MRNSFGNWLWKNASHDEKQLLLVGDIGFGIFDQYIAEYPNNFFNCGIAEQNMIGVAAGLSSAGYRPWVYTIIPFLIARPLEFIKNLLGYQNLPVNLVGVGGGLSYDNLGYTHYALEDLGILSLIPNFRILIPYDPISTVFCLEKASDFVAPTYIRLMKGGESDIPVVDVCDGYSKIHHSGDDILFITYGSLVREIKDLADTLFKKSRIKSTVIAVWDYSSIELINTCGYDAVFIVEEHFSPGIIYSKLNLHSTSNIKRIYVPHNLHNELMSRSDYLNLYGLCGSKLEESVINYLFSLEESK